MSEVMIYHMRDLAVGDGVSRFGDFDDVKIAVVTRVDAAAKEVTMRMLDGSGDVTYPWDSKRSKGYNKVKAVRNELAAR
jgi:hypothetical protein